MLRVERARGAAWRGLALVGCTARLLSVWSRAYTEERGGPPWGWDGELQAKALQGRCKGAARALQRSCMGTGCRGAANALQGELQGPPRRCKAASTFCAAVALAHRRRSVEQGRPADQVG